MRLTPSYALEFFRRRGWWGLLRLALYPATSLVSGPVQLARTLLTCGPLLGPRRSDYAHFNPVLALTSFFYWNADLNLSRFGRTGKSDLLGSGQVPLGQAFHYSSLSLGAYRRAGALTVLLGMGVWCLSHAVWLREGNGALGLCVLALMGASSFFHYQTFQVQTYHALGWAFFPLGLYGVLTDQPWIAAAGWMGVVLGSTTAGLFAGLFALGAALMGQMDQGLAFLPAGLKLASHGRFLLGGGEGLGVLSRMAGLIGFRRRGVKYRRPEREWTVRDKVFLMAASVYAAGTWAWTGQWAWPVVLAGILLAINALLIRFADEQSPQVVLVSAASAWTLMAGRYELLILLWCVAFPPPALLKFGSLPAFDLLPVSKPFNVRPLLEAARSFLGPVPPGSRILMAFEDPRGSYGKLFDGYRALLEAPCYAAAEKSVLMMPNWWMVMQWNSPGDPDFWGRNPAALRENLRRWEANFAVAYEDGSEGVFDWEKEGFEVLGRLDWALIPDSHSWIKKDPSGQGRPLVWRLLKARAEKT